MAIDRDKVVLSAVTSVTVDSVEVGATQGGVFVRNETTYKDVQCDQIIGTWKKKVTDIKYFVRFNILEQALANWRLAWNLASGNLSGSTLTLDETDGGEITVVIVGTGPGGATQTVTMTRCVSLASTEIPLGQKTDESVVTMELEVLPNDTNDFGTVVNS